jgi:hypothetical protein
MAVPKATVPTTSSALVCPAGTVTVAGTVTIPAGLADTATSVSTGCEAEIVTVSVVLAPSVTEFVGGRSDTTVGRAAVTVTVLVALVLLRLAVICAVPGVLAETVIGALVWPAGTVTLAGTEAIAESVLLKATTALVLCAALIATVNVPVPPCVIVSVLGSRLVMVGGAGVTCTVALALPPLRDTVMTALPDPTAVTGTGTLLCPLVKEIDDGTVATPALTLLTVSTPEEVGVGESVAVKVPVAPAVMVKGFGVKAVGVGRILVPSTLIVRTPLMGSLTVTWRVFVGWSVMGRSKPVTFDEKSEGDATRTPFSTIVAEVTRCAPLASPFTRCRRNGAPIEEGTANESVTVTGAPVVR